MRLYNKIRGDGYRLAIPLSWFGGLMVLVTMFLVGAHAEVDYRRVELHASPKNLPVCGDEKRVVRIDGHKVSILIGAYWSDIIAEKGGFFRRVFPEQDKRGMFNITVYGNIEARVVAIELDGDCRWTGNW